MTNHNTNHRQLLSVAVQKFHACPGDRRNWRHVPVPLSLRSSSMLLLQLSLLDHWSVPDTMSACKWEMHITVTNINIMMQNHNTLIYNHPFHTTYLPSVLWRCLLGVGNSIRSVKHIGNEVLVWLCVCSKVQMVSAYGSVDASAIPSSLACGLKIKLCFIWINVMHLCSSCNKHIINAMMTLLCWQQKNTNCPPLTKISSYFYFSIWLSSGDLLNLRSRLVRCCSLLKGHSGAD